MGACKACGDIFGVNDLKDGICDKCATEGNNATEVQKHKEVKQTPKIIKKYCLGKNPIVLSKKSIITYIKPIGILLILAYFGYQYFPIIGIFFSIIIFGVYIYIRSYTLFIDDAGVWVFHGLFPWSKGVSGIKWSDFSEATYSQNFFSWALSSYTVTAKNKFKGQSEFVLYDMHNGDTAVAKINSVSQNKDKR